VTCYFLDSENIFFTLITTGNFAFQLHSCTI